MVEGRERTRFDMVAGLPLRAKFEAGQTQKRPFLRFFYLNPLQIRGVTFLIAKIWSEKLGMGTHFCQH